MWQNNRSARGFALYEVLIGLTIFVLGVLVIGRSVQNCLNASLLSSEDDRVRQILANRMAEVQVASGSPDTKKETKVATGYGDVLLVQQSVPAALKGENNTELSGINLVTLRADWKRNGILQSRKIEFYVYRPG